MSCAAAHQSKQVRQNCQGCHVRKARFQYRGAVKADRDHVLCFECYRSEVNPQRAYRLASSPARRRRFIDPRGRSVEVSRLNNGYVEPLVVSEGRCASVVIAGFDVDLSELFADGLAI